jgi:hypothetical protein
MIELDPFYEKLQASLLESLHFPRCSHYVTDKHGICSNFHENAYQWRHLSVIRNTMSFKVCCSSYSTPKERIQRWIDHDEKRTLWSYSCCESDQSHDSLIQARNYSSKSVQVAEDGRNSSLESKFIIQRDLERQNYNMKETTLASCLVVALGIAPKSVDGHLLSDWKRATNSIVGDFSIIASQVMEKRHHRPCMDLSIPALNSLLDCLTISTTREAKGSVLRELISKTTAGEMKWVLHIILKDLRIGLGENSILDEIHPDARDMMASCVDLKNVFLHLHSRSVRYLRQDLVVGKPVKCQHSK